MFKEYDNHIKISLKRPSWLPYLVLSIQLTNSKERSKEMCYIIFSIGQQNTSKVTPYKLSKQLLWESESFVIYPLAQYVFVPLVKKLEKNDAPWVCLFRLRSEF